MKILLKTSLMLTLILVAFGSKSFAQQWTAEQKDVWAGVEKYWAADASGDAKAFLSYFDESYQGWSYQSPVPMGKADVAKYIENDYKNNTTVLYTISPASAK